MVKLTGEAAAKQLDSWWRRIRRSFVPRQQIIHVLKPLTDEQFYKYEAYRQWRKAEGDKAEISALLRKEVGLSEYLKDVAGATRNGARNVRIFFAGPGDFGNSPTIQRYVAEVHYPFLADEVGEIIWMISPEDYLAAGFSIRDIDVSLYGAAGILRNEYDDQGKLALREFLPWWRHPWLTFKERRFVLRVERFARRHGTRILPAGQS